VDSFTVRIKPQKDECLTTYMLRVCHLNKVPIIDVLRRLNKTYAAFDIRKSHSIDINPSRVLDLFRCSELFSLNFDCLLNHTINPFLIKFISPEKLNNIKISDTLLTGLLNINSRRYCVSCLKEEAIYKITWQFRCVDVCDKHLTPLRSKCSLCNKEQPYLHKYLLMSKCYYCKSTLIADPQFPLLVESWTVNHNIWIYNEILSFNKLSFPKVVPSFQQSFFIYKLLYLCSSRSKTFDVNKLQVISRDYKYKLLNALKENKEEFKTIVSISQFIKILSSNKLNIVEFQSLSVPNEFVNSVNKHIYPEVCKKCLSPWCDSYNSNKKLIKISAIRSKTHLNIHLCYGCSLKFGYNKNNKKWEEYGDIINIGYQSVMGLINSLYSIKDISIRLNISRYKVDKFVAYLTRFNLINPNIRNKFTPLKANSLDYSHFYSILTTNETENISKAKAYYKISRRDIYYFYFDPVIQRSIFTKDIDKLAST